MMRRRVSSNTTTPFLSTMHCIVMFVFLSLLLIQAHAKDDDTKSSVRRASASSFDFSSSGLAHGARQLATWAQQEQHQRHLVDSLQPFCDAMETNFPVGVNCVCTGASLSTFSIACEYLDQVCSPLGSTCGKPFLMMSMVDYSIFSSTVCINNYTRNDIALNNTCLSIELCDDDTTEGLGFCGCTAQYGGKTCQSCEVCSKGRGLQMDCSNVNAEMISNENCEMVDTDLDFSGATSLMTGFLPNIHGLCSDLEEALDNRIQCDCSDSGGGNFEISCATQQDICQGSLCGSTSSTVTYVSGHMHKVHTCADWTAPKDFPQSCVEFTLKNGTKQLESCSATYDGQACNSCSICDNNSGITLDCTNVREWAVVGACQETSVVRALEFVPNFQSLNVAATANDGSKTNVTSSATRWSCRAAIMVVGLFLLAIVG